MSSASLPTIDDQLATDPIPGGIAVSRPQRGSGYVSRLFAKACRLHGLRHLRTRPYTPKTNGKAERFIQTLVREWAYRPPYRNAKRRAAQLLGWLEF